MPKYPRPTDLVRGLGRQVCFFPSLAKIVGIEAAIFASQFLYWTPRAKDGWIFKSSAEIDIETALSYKQQLSARKILVEHGILQERYDRQDHQMYFRLDIDGMDNLLTPTEAHPESGNGTNEEHLPGEHVPVPQREDTSTPKGMSYKETEIISESTIESTVDIPSTTSEFLNWQQAKDKHRAKKEARKKGQRFSRPSIPFVPRPRQVERQQESGDTRGASRQYPSRAEQRAARTEEVLNRVLGGG